MPHNHPEKTVHSKDSHHPFISEIQILLSPTELPTPFRLCSKNMFEFYVGSQVQVILKKLSRPIPQNKVRLLMPRRLCQPDIKILQEAPPFVKSTTLGAKLKGTAFKVLNHLHFSVIYFSTGVNTVTKLEKEGTKARIEIQGREEIP